jgi:tripartite-type tricarboxylate transporter receptor subunit TctC
MLGEIGVRCLGRRAALRHCWIFALAFFVMAASAFAAAADDAYPKKTIRLLVGFGAGGPTDIPARFVANKLSDALGQPVIVENKPAAAGIMATRDLLAEPADGYTLLLCTHFDPINVAMYRNVGFKLSDLMPISLIAEYYYGLALANAIPADSFEAFVAYAKAHPGEVTYATIGAGSAQEIMARQLQKLAGITMNRIPFRGGPQVVQEMMAGRVDFYVSPTLGIVPQYQSKQIKILATTSPQRLANLPEVPTVREKGIDFVRFGWLGICAANGTPASIIKTLHDKIVPIVAMPEYHTLIENGGSTAMSSTPDELGAVIKKTSNEVTSSIQEFGMQQDQQ